MLKVIQLIIIYISLFLGFIITTIPWSRDLLAFKPYWILALIIYWSASQPKLVGYITALVVGIIFDSLSGSVLGEHAICYIVITFFNRRLSLVYKDVNWGYRITIVTLLVFGYSLIYMLLEIFSYNIMSFDREFWVPIPITVFIWLWLNLAFKNFNQYFRTSQRNKLVK